MKVTIIPIVIGTLATVTKVAVQGGFGNNRTSGDHRKYCIIEIGQNTVVARTPARNHQLTLV